MRIAIALISGLLAAAASVVQAAVIFSPTSTVGTPHRLAEFDNVPGDGLAGLPSPYVEDSLDLTFSPSPGGYFRHTFTEATVFWGPIFFPSNPQFSGRAAYFAHDGQSPYTPLRIATTDGADVSAMQFNVDTGYGGTMYAYWEAYRDGLIVGSGQVDTNADDLLFGFSGDLFDELRVGTYFTPFNNFSFQGENGNAIAIDNVAVAFAVPEPGSLALLTLGFVGLALTRRRKQ